MRAYITGLLIFWWSSVAHCQQAKVASCYQYLNTDSSHLELVSQAYYDAAGHCQREVLLNQRWESARSFSPQGDITTYKYRDTLLLKETTVFGRDHEKFQRRYYYNAQGQRLRQLGFKWEHEIKPSHRYREDGGYRDVFGQHDIQRRLTKTQVADVFYCYDKLGRRVAMAAPRLSYGTENRYQWTYDNLNRIIEAKVYQDSTLLNETLYRYQQNSFSRTRVWYERSGEKSAARTLSWEYMPEYTTVYLTDTAELPRKLLLRKRGWPLTTKPSSTMAMAVFGV